MALTSLKSEKLFAAPELSLLPKSNNNICGVANIRGACIPILDLAMATGLPGITDKESAFIRLTEYNNRVQGFLVYAVEHIVNLNWEDIHPPPKGSGDNNYLTAVTRTDDRLVEIIDVERC